MSKPYSNRINPQLLIHLFLLLHHTVTRQVLGSRGGKSHSAFRFWMLSIYITFSLLVCFAGILTHLFLRLPKMIIWVMIQMWLIFCSCSLKSSWQTAGVGEAKQHSPMWICHNWRDRAKIWMWIWHEDLKNPNGPPYSWMGCSGANEDGVCWVPEVRRRIKKRQFQTWHSVTAGRFSHMRQGMVQLSVLFRIIGFCASKVNTFCSYSYMQISGSTGPKNRGKVL